MENKSWAGVSWDSIPQKLQREQRESRRIVGRPCLRPHCTAGILIPHHHPKPGLRCASPFMIQDAPPCSATHETVAWSPPQLKPRCKQKEGFRKKEGAGNLWARFKMSQSLCQGRGKASSAGTAASEGQNQYSTWALEKRPFLCLEKRNQHTERKTFRLGSEWAVSTPSRCWAAPHWGL